MIETKLCETCREIKNVDDFFNNYNPKYGYGRRCKECINKNKGTNKKLYIYIISNPTWPNWYKIGITSDPYRRLSSYQTASPYRDYEIVYSRKTTKAKEIESYLINQSNNHQWINQDIDLIIKIIETLC